MEQTFTNFTLANDTQVYSLRFDFNHICDAETETNMNLMSALSGRSVNAAQARGLLYACLKTGHPQVTLAEAGGLLSRDMGTVLDALRKALGRGEPDGDAATEPTKESA